MRVVLFCWFLGGGVGAGAQDSAFGLGLGMQGGLFYRILHGLHSGFYRAL